jgi:beta-aspartyl-peptidase (threonine type)
MQLPLIIVHGGAGAWKDERIPVGVEYVRKAAVCGSSVLEEGGSALDAAEACTVFMESCGQLNAGKGARPNQDGILELDAMIIDGSKTDFGSVAAITGIQNPIAVARYIMERTDYKFFAGLNARRVYERMVEEGYRVPSDLEDTASSNAHDTGDTVGCVVVDSEGNIAATSSTGGIPKKAPGRVGDSPVMGAGAYANVVCGASATGYGEHIMRVVLSRMTVLYVEEGLDPGKAAEKGMKMFEKTTGSEAGIVVADSKGRWGYATNAKAMPVAVIHGALDEITSFTCQEEPGKV